MLHALSLNSHGQPINGSSVHASVGKCKVEDEAMSVWMSQRIGPFTSTGGYDWWFLSMVDLPARIDGR